MYSDAQSLFFEVRVVCKSLPHEHKFSLGDQLSRSSLSVILNIAEGSGKRSDKELGRYLDIALGSLYETLAALDTLKRNGFLGEVKFTKLRDTISDICTQIGAFKRKFD